MSFDWNYERKSILGKAKKPQGQRRCHRQPPYLPYISLKNVPSLWIPNLGVFHRLPMKLIILMKRAYFAASSTNNNNIMIVPSMIHGLLQALITSGDLIYDIEERISIFTTPNDKYLLWRCEPCQTMCMLSYEYITRCSVTNTISYANLSQAFVDPRSMVNKHIKSEKHSVALESYKMTEMKYWKTFATSSMPDFFARIFQKNYCC